MRAFVVYALLRAALFIVPFAILVAAQVQWYVALAIALLFAFAASSIFLRRQKQAVSDSIAARREARGDRADEDVEDDAVDGDRAEPVDGEPVDAGTEPVDGAEPVDGTVTTADVDPDVVTDAQADADASAADASDERTDR